MTPADGMVLLASGVVSYLLGSIPVGFLFVKGLKGIDIRTIGSGSTGATNVARVLGLWSFFPVFALDFAKGFVATFFIAPYASGITVWDRSMELPLTQIFCAIAAMCGHLFPLFLSFRGGKGVATAAGIIVALNYTIAAIAFGVWLVVMLVFRYVSLSSMIASLSLPIAHAALCGMAETRDSIFAIFYCIVCALVLVMHRANMRRLLDGKESRVTWGKTS